MHHYRQGEPTRQAHKGIPEGHFEEEQGLKGFFGPVSHLIRPAPSTRWVKIDGPLKPRLFDLVKLQKPDTIQRLLFNAQLSLSQMTKSPSGSANCIAQRNADGDTIYFCHKGSGQVFTDYGLLEFSSGDYVVIPKCLTHYIRVAEDSVFLVIENRNSHFEEPDRGMVGRNAVYDTEAFYKPDLSAQNEELKKLEKEVIEVRVKHRDEITTFTYESNIFDVVGWKGDLFPYVLSMSDMMPLMSHRAHLPPSAHTSFVARDFVICSFLPRPLEQDEDALKVPFYHQNIDYDEVLFYHDGNFFSRDNLHAGMMSFHPAGFAHGPHPKAVNSIKEKTHTDEYAVMVDSRWPLEMDPGIESTEVKNYWQSWM